VSEDEDVFLGEEGYRLPVPAGWKSWDRFFYACVTGETLAGEGIHDGDMAVVRVNFKDSELTPGRLIAATTPYGLLLKRIYQSPDGKTVRLVSANPDYGDLVLDRGDVEIRGVVVQTVRCWN
jgi:SOS-response transcriptional repressor LexA